MSISRTIAVVHALNGYVRRHQPQTNIRTVAIVKGSFHLGQRRTINSPKLIEFLKSISINFVQLKCKRFLHPLWINFGLILNCVKMAVTITLWWIYTSVNVWNVNVRPTTTYLATYEIMTSIFFLSLILSYFCQTSVSTLALTKMQKKIGQKNYAVIKDGLKHTNSQAHVHDFSMRPFYFFQHLFHVFIFFNTFSMFKNLHARVHF